ncbi:LLM class flavin-dependent oxidoreductase [Campylobacter hyointestinalis]|uniref:LLM class flavin-dependent oxidoreductase n=1 Tax=Campylobacter hyointestinalis subsp. hyointestinalis TaxID=91352 RepID=A0A855N9R3_CAMHY|nr:LLM class flavin-dependent oxidoreductase [Campylobacter hyointestinalis]PPB57723.1 LLM class flavin-dependent oxidoreductase [Campylobacter hyointestinalis subsp. hyointestinalis]PPB62559.1 LLM class flavin-dependent oxidoreductase [Campylobacter hyointestinalis subsp. hyointestinalis]PPB71216.1 LLM class flavin-dependent oxidoreductase [Campylobacter hyointestinalis subsp. hyointestinalis]
MRHGIFALFENLENDEKKSFKEAFKTIKFIEKLGFDEAWISEHHFNSFSLTSSPVALAAYALAKTKRLKIGVAGFILPAYDTLRLASDISNLEAISGGRLITGFAKGSFPIIDKVQGRNPNLNRKIMLEKLDELNFMFDELNITPKVNKPQFYMASVHDESLGFAARRGYPILASIRSSIDDVLSIKERYKKIAGFYPKMGLIRAININKNKDKSSLEASKAISFFFKAMTGAQNEATFEMVKDSEYEKLRNEFFDPKLLQKFAITGDVKECKKQVLELVKATNIDHIILKPAALSYKRHKEILKDYDRRIMPYV